MHFAFVDIASSYRADTPYKEALGGTQAAACYLAIALVKAGHKASLINQERMGGKAYGVESLPPEALNSDEALKCIDVLVFNGRWSGRMVDSLKRRTQAHMIAYMHEAVFGDAYVQPHPAFSDIVFVSAWQKKMNADKTPPEIKAHVIANGVAPFFHELAGAATARDPVLVYAGSSKRGLLDLPSVLPAIHRRFPQLKFAIYSDCVVSREQIDCDNFKFQLRGLPNVVHVGPVNQQELARAMARAQFFLSPNNYPETFCIALAEAMRAGCHAIITNRAALPETAAGFASLVPVQDPDNPQWLRLGLDLNFFANSAIAAIHNWLALPEATRAERIDKQCAYVDAHYNWAKAAQAWLALAGA